MNENATTTFQENSNNEAITNLIQSIQSKLNNELDTSDTKNSKDNNIDIPIDNANKENDENHSPKSSNTTFDLGSIIGLLGNMGGNNSKAEESGFDFGNLDPNLFNKLKTIVVSLGKKDPKKDLLISLKPFLRKSRQDKIGEYITILTVIKAFEAFNDKGSDKNE